MRAQLKSIPCHISKCFLALVNQSESQNWSCYTNSLFHLSPLADLAALFDAWPRLYLLYWLYLTSPYPSARMRSKGYCTQYTCEVAMRSQQNHLSPWGDLGVPIMCLSLFHSCSLFMVYYGDGCSPITNNNVFLFLGWSNSTLDSQSKGTPGGS